tara:strand:- start:630 stop:1304 length:675 start_codon:yes stop_codon:yes gene_type:complete
MDYKAIATNLNYDLGKTDLVMLTFGNGSVVNKNRTKVYIKPSGIDYKTLTNDDIAVVSLESGELIEGLKPSVDLNIHLEIYRNFKNVNSVIHTHSKFVTVFAQARKEIPIIGTTHADYFKNTIPLTEELSESEIKSDYEKNIGNKVVKLFNNINPLDTPAALISNHGCVVFGKDSKRCLENALVLEYVAEIAYFTNDIEKTKNEEILYEFHHERKHGKDKYYGQ